MWRVPGERHHSPDLARHLGCPEPWTSGCQNAYERTYQQDSAQHSELWTALEEFPIHQAAATRCQKWPAQPCTEPFHTPLSTPARHCTPRAKGNGCPRAGLAAKTCPGATSSYHGNAAVGGVMGGKQRYWDWRIRWSWLLWDAGYAPTRLTSQWRDSPALCKEGPR